MKKLITLTLFIALGTFTSCSQKGKAPVTIKFNASKLSTGILNTGGMVLVGKNTSNGVTFSMGIPDPNANPTLSLSFGIWEFGVIGWDGAAPFTGTNRCGIATAELSQADQTVDIFLDASVCSDPRIVADPAFYWDDGTAINQFKKWRLVSCSNLAGITGVNQSCLPALGSPRRQGESNSFRIGFVGSNTDGPIPPDFYSGCITNNDIMNPDHTPMEKIPLMSSAFPFYIQGYEDSNCLYPDASYNYQNGIGSPTSGAAALLFSGSTVVPGGVDFYLPDNYAGAASTPLVDLVPFMDNSLLPAVTQVNYFHSGAINALDRLSEIAGTPDGLQSHNLPKKASFYVGDIQLLYATPGSIGNGIQINMIDNQATNTATITESSPGVFDITYGGTWTTLSNFVTIINASTGTTNIEAILRPGAIGTNTMGSGWFGGPMSDGQDPSTDNWRNSGLIGETAQIFGSGWMALMYKRGYLNCSNIKLAANGTVESFVFGPGDYFDIILEDTTGIPSELIPAGMTGAGTTFDKRITIYENGFLEASILLNCPSADGGNGFPMVGRIYTSHDDYDGSINGQEWVYDLTAPGAYKIETINYHEYFDGTGLKNWKAVTRYDETSTDTFNLWSTSMNLEGDALAGTNNNFSKLAVNGKKSAKLLYLEEYNLNGDLDSGSGNYIGLTPYQSGTMLNASMVECFNTSTYLQEATSMCSTTNGMAYTEATIVSTSDFNYSDYLINFSFEQLNLAVPFDLGSF